MSSDPTVTPPPADVLDTQTEEEKQRVHFSSSRWFLTGLVRLSYRLWTRVAVRLFPEDSKAERVAQSLHIPLPDKLNMSWVTRELAVGGRVRIEDIPALARAGVTHVIDTRSEYCDDVKAMAHQDIELLPLPRPDPYPLTVEKWRQGAALAQKRIP